MSEWKEYKLSELLEIPIRNGLTKPKSIRGQGVKMIGMREIFAYDIIRDCEMELVPVTEKEMCTSSILQDDLLFARQSLTLEGAGKCSIVGSVSDPTVFESHLIRLRINKNLANPYYIYYYFNSKYGKEQIKGLVQQVAAAGIRGKELINLRLSIPSLPSQQKIANILSSLDDKIEVNRRINEQLEELAGALFKSWFVDFELFKDGDFVESELGMIPKGWKVVEVGELCESISVKHKFDKNELIFLNTGDIHNNIYLHNNYMPINEMPGQAKKSIRKGDILYSEIRPINKHFAFVNFEANDYVVSTKLMVIRCRNINNLRLYQYLTSNEIIDFLQQEAETRSGTFPQIRFENIQRLKMIIASPIVEEQYDKNLLPIYNKIETNNKEITHLTTLRDTLLPKLISGEIDVNEVEI